ncbi:CopG family transcriptional regulator [Candidatus Bathyarchaeota archaeon]|nr:CopG family transcriptional regulator [Candidatus Bathyarchaeota archaeon]
MSSTYTIRLPEELKEKMRETELVWSEEIRAFIEQRINSLKLIEVIEEVGERSEERVLSIDSTILIREDRER